MFLRTQVTSEFQFGAFAWALKVHPQAPLAWNRDEPGLGLSLTRRPPPPAGGAGRPGGEGLLCRLCHRMSVGPAGAAAGDGSREEGERRDEIIAAGQGGIPNRRWHRKKEGVGQVPWKWGGMQ